MATITRYDIQRVVAFTRDMLSEHPEHEEDIIGLASVALDEIDSGESADNELELMQDSINELISS